MYHLFRFIVFLILAIVLGAVSTAFFISTGIDWNWAVYFNRNEFWVWLSAPFVLLGMLVPFAIILYYFFRYKKKGVESDLLNYRRSLLTFVVTYVLMTLLKVFTNRVDMEPFEPIGSIDISGQFRFGFMNSNSWWESFSEGWPSGHTMIALGMALAIHPLLQGKWTRRINFLYPILVALSVSTAFHWLSDVVAGALIGMVVGIYFSRFPMKEKQIRNQQ